MIFAYTVLLFLQLVNKENTNISQINIFNNDISNPMEHRIGEAGVGVALKFKSGDIDLLQENDYITFEINQVTQIRSNGDKTRDRILLPYTTWGLDYPYSDKSEIIRLGIDEYYWPESYTYSIQGSYYSNTFKYIEMRAIRWTDETVWKTYDEIKTVLSDARFEVAIIDSYVDNSDYVSPIKTLIQDGLYWDIVPSVDVRGEIYVAHNHAVFQDNYIQFYNNREVSFYSISSEKSLKMESSDHLMLEVFISVDSLETTTERRIYSFGDFLAQSGGVYGFLIIIGNKLIALNNIGSSFISVFTDRLYASSLLKRIYQIDTFKDDFKLRKPKKNKTNLNFKDIGPNQETRVNFNTPEWLSDKYWDRVISKMRLYEKTTHEEKKHHLLNHVLKGKINS